MNLDNFEKRKNSFGGSHANALYDHRVDMLRTFLDVDTFHHLHVKCLFHFTFRVKLFLCLTILPCVLNLS